MHVHYRKSEICDWKEVHSNTAELAVVASIIQIAVVGTIGFRLSVTSFSLAKTVASVYQAIVVNSKDIIAHMLGPQERSNIP